MKNKMLCIAIAMAISTTAFAWITPSTAKLVKIDIKPCSNPNTINAKSHGVISVAIYADEEFDVHDVIIESLSFLGARPCKYSYEDNYLMLHFYKSDMTFPASGNYTATVSGYYKINGKLIHFLGHDTIRIIHS